MSDIISSEAQHGVGHFFTNQFGENFLYEVNGSVFNTVGSEVAYKKYYGEEIFRKDTLYIFIGSDSGLLIKHIQNHGVTEGSYYIFIEPEALYEKIRKQYPSETIDYRILLCTDKNWKEIAREIDLNNYIFSENVRIVPSFAARDAFYEGYLDLSIKIENEFRQHAWTVTSNIKVEYYINRQLDNLAELHTPFIKLQNIYPGKTCVIMAGGPSLDESISWIKSNKDNLIIFAVSRIARKLINEDIKPDFIVSVDPKHGSFDIGKDMLSFWKDAVFIHSYHVDNYLSSQWRGKSVYLGPRFPWDSKLNNKNIASVGPTVTQTSLKCAIEMGFSEIILCGVDHCYSPEGYTHAQNTDEHDIGPQHNYFGTSVETNGGDLAETKEEFKSGITAIEVIVSSAKSKNFNIKVINPSKNSARISGVEHITLDNIDIIPLSSSDKNTYTLLPDRTNDDRIADLSNVLDELSEMKVELRTVKNLSREALKYNKKAHQNFDIESKNKVDKIEEKLHKKYEKAATIATNYNASEFLKNTIVDESREFTMGEIQNYVNNYFNNLIESSIKLSKQINEAEERIRSRIEECKSSPNFEIIFKQWDKDNTPGRAKLLLDYHGDDTILDSVKDKIDSYLELFDKLLHNTSTNFRNELESASNNINVVKSKANYLFKYKDIKNLNNLSTSLHKHKSGDNWKEITALVDAYINELSNNYDEALMNFQELLNGKYQTDALKHILNISINIEDYTNALLALECLSETLPIYMPFYAEMLHLAGKNSDSINTYTEYLTKVPEDTSTWLKLGKLYLDLNVLDSAKWVFEQVKEIDPDNTAVDSYLSQLQVH